MIFLRKRLRRASLGGHWFFLNDTNIETGRRVGRFEFPFQEKPVVEDLGKQGQLICIAGFVAGANYRSDADRLMKACESKGPVDFFHPYYGKRKVICKSCRVNENNIEGGIIYFYFQLYETVDTKDSAFGLQNLPILGMVGGAEAMASASKVITDCIDTANDWVGQIDQFNDSVLMMTELFEKTISPLLHLGDSVNNFGYAINDLRRSVSQDTYLGTTGLLNAFETVKATILGATLDESDPYHWTREFPPERIDPLPPFWPIQLGSKAFIVGLQTTEAFKHFEQDTPKKSFHKLEALRMNLDLTLRDSEPSPELYQKLTKIKSLVIHHLFSEPLLSMRDEEIDGTPKKCLILEAYEERGGLEGIESLLDQYRHSSTLFP